MPPLSRGFGRLRLKPGLLNARRGLQTSVTTGRDRFLQVSGEVQDAVNTGKPVVALETTIYTHGRLESPYC